LLSRKYDLTKLLPGAHLKVIQSQATATATTIKETLNFALSFGAKNTERNKKKRSKVLKNECMGRLTSWMHLKLTEGHNRVGQSQHTHTHIVTYTHTDTLTVIIIVGALVEAARGWVSYI